MQLLYEAEASRQRIAAMAVAIGNPNDSSLDILIGVCALRIC